MRSSLFKFDSYASDEKSGMVLLDLGHTLRPKCIARSLAASSFKANSSSDCFT